MNDEKEIAQTVIDAQKMREESYTEYQHIPTCGPLGEYKLEIEECLIIVGKQHNLSPNLWYLLSLAMHWWNDLQLWAEDTLAGKNTYSQVLTPKKKKGKKLHRK